MHNPRKLVSAGGHQPASHTKSLKSSDTPGPHSTSLTISDRRFDDINVDIVVPLPQSDAFCYLFTCFDRYTRWSEAIPNMTVETCARALLEGWITRFGLPWCIMFDRRRQFESNIWASQMFPLGIKSNCTTAYHPQSNGIVERFHQQLMASLKAHLNDPNWREELLIIMFGIRTSVKEDIKCSALNAGEFPETFSTIRIEPLSIIPYSSTDSGTRCTGNA